MRHCFPLHRPGTGDWSGPRRVPVPCWATLGNERFGLVAIPDSVTELHLFIDADAGGDLALARGLETYARPGRAIISHRPDGEGDDWNDVLARLRSKMAA
jgi:hypothetical protein